MSKLKSSLLAIASGLLLAASFPPWNVWPLAWLWLGPLLIVLWWSRPVAGTPRTPWAGFYYGWLAGFTAFLATLWWIVHVTFIGPFALCAYLALFGGIFSAAAVWCRPRGPVQGILSALLLACLWTGLEWVRNWLLTGFPWNGAAVPLLPMPGVRAFATLVGVTGLSIAPLFFQLGLAAAFKAWRRDRISWPFFIAGLVPAALSIGGWRQRTSAGPEVSVLLMQPNLNMQEKYGSSAEQQLSHYEVLVQDTLTALQSRATRPDLVVWPEAAIPFPFDDPAHETFLGAFGTPIIVGIDARGGVNGPSVASELLPFYNCLALIPTTLAEAQLHAKVCLVPFGEFLPLRKELPFMESWLGALIPNNFTRGASYEPLTHPKTSIIPLICFEDTMADHARKFVREGPQLIVNATNNNWFGESSATQIHLINARWRCVELDRAMVRSGNTGATCVIDGDGRIQDMLPDFQKGALHAAVRLTKGDITFYARHGDVFSMSALGFGLIGVVVLGLRGRR